jgi:hypothetical protein
VWAGSRSFPSRDVGINQGVQVRVLPSREGVNAIEGHVTASDLVSCVSLELDERAKTCWKYKEFETRKIRSVRREISKLRVGKHADYIRVRTMISRSIRPGS